MKKYPTPEQIAAQTDHLNRLANIRAINKQFRQQDESHLFPINGRFNATERAIRQACRIANANGPVYGLEYCYLLDNLISTIVNKW
jgi:hypothetical protein